MDVNALRVFNSLKKLDITEAEFKDIEEEQQHFERTGLAIVAVKKGVSVCVSHDEKHQIILKRLTHEGTLPKAKSRVLFKTLAQFNDMPAEIYTLHQIAQYRALDAEIRHVSESIDDLKLRVMDRFADDYPKELGDMYDDVYAGSDERQKNKKRRPELVEKQLKALYWLFDEPYSEISSNSRANVPKIVKVFSRNNRRVAIIQAKEDFDKNRSCGLYGGRWMERVKRVALKVITFTPRDPRYNYVCPGREIYLPFEWRDKGQIWLDDPLCEKITVEELKVLSTRLASGRDEWIFLTADKYNSMQSALRLELLSAKRKEQEETAKKRLARNVEQSFKNGKAVRQGIEFTRKSVSYQGIAFSGSKIGEYIESQNILFQERPDFIEIFHGYVDYILKPDVKHHNYSWEVSAIDYGFEGKEEMKVKGIKASIEKKGKNLYINNFRISKEDAGSAVKISMQSASQEEYDAWLKQTSRINLKLQKALEQGGMEFKLRIDKTEDNCLLKEDDATNMLLTLPLHREKNRIYTSIEGRQYKVKNTNAIFNLGKDIDSVRVGMSGGGYLQRTIRLLYQALEGISPKEIGGLIENGKKAYVSMHREQEKERLAKLRKSREFIEHAVRLSKAEKTDKGYLVEGISKTIYYVGDDLSVYTVKDGKQDKYLCIIDIGSDDSDAGRNDAIAKRLLMLSKDKVVADEIYQEGDKMDKHWLEIQEVEA
ncbi:MAG: hypothetical protein ABII22_04540 [Candidatus Micrarchaeota archaeon]